MRRVFDLCGHECSRGELVYNTKSKMLEYPEYLKAIANYNEKFDLKKTLTCEVSYCIYQPCRDLESMAIQFTSSVLIQEIWGRRGGVMKCNFLKFWPGSCHPPFSGNEMCIFKALKLILIVRHCLGGFYVI